MMTERQAEFRKAYRARVAGWYNGFVHVAVIYAIGFTAMWIYAQHIHAPAWWEWLIVPVTLLGCNMFEWFLHKYVMHRPPSNRVLRAIYERHTLDHHRFFSDKEMRFRDDKDWRVTFFPPYALVIFILMSSVGVLVLSIIATENIAWLFIASTTAMYLIYEFMHFCCHVDENWFVRNAPLINTLRRHHTAHHNEAIMMDLNMNLTFPITDWLFGTSDLKRGLLGHLFNGYNDKYVRDDLRERPLRPDEAAATPVPIV